MAGNYTTLPTHRTVQVISATQVLDVMELPFITSPSGVTAQVYAPYVSWLAEGADTFIAPVATAIDAAWVAEEGSVARHAGAAFVDPTVWVCPTGPCPAVIGRYIVYRDTHHLATPFVAALASRLRDRLPAPVGPSPAAPTVASPTARP